MTRIPDRFRCRPITDLDSSFSLIPERDLTGKALHIYRASLMAVNLVEEFFPKEDEYPPYIIEEDLQNFKYREFLTLIMEALDEGETDVDLSITAFITHISSSVDIEDLDIPPVIRSIEYLTFDPDYTDEVKYVDFLIRKSKHKGSSHSRSSSRKRSK